MPARQKSGTTHTLKDPLSIKPLTQTRGPPHTCDRLASTGNELIAGAHTHTHTLNREMLPARKAVDWAEFGNLDRYVKFYDLFLV